MGALMTHLFQRRAAVRDQRFAMTQQLRSERMTAYSDFAGALTEFRRGQHDRWHRKNEDPDSSACFNARVEAYRLRGVALHALFRVELISSGQSLTDAAREAYELTSDVHKADDRGQLSANGESASVGLERFVELASSDVR